MTLPCLAPRRGKGPAYAVVDTGYSSPCWLWQGSLNSKGYPLRGTKDGLYLVHRQVFLEAGGVLAQGEEAHHLCQQRSCVNPQHVQGASPLVHRRTHGAPVAAALLDALAEGLPLRHRELVHIALDAGSRSGEVGTALRRMVDRGEIQRLARGLYALPPSPLTSETG